MKNMKKAIAGCAVLLALAATSVTAFASAAYETPAEAAAGVTGKTIEEVTSERQSGKSYGKIAAEAGKLEEFQQDMLDIREDVLNQKVTDGTLTQEQAESALAAMEDRQAACDGTGASCSSNGPRCNGICSNESAGHRQGNGHGNGGKKGMGMGARDGSCLNQ